MSDFINIFNNNYVSEIACSWEGRGLVPSAPLDLPLHLCNYKIIQIMTYHYSYIYVFLYSHNNIIELLYFL